MLGRVQVSFVAQPFANGRDLDEFLKAVAADDTINELDVVVAWAKRSGLRRVRPYLEAVRDRPGATRLIVGIDEGGATRQGLELAREIFSLVHVFHDNSWRTFHPKIYLGVGPDRARLLVGSNNLTAGGVFYNYEAALECVLTLPEDQHLVDEVRAYIDRLYADADVCKALDDALLAELISKSRYRVGDEDARKPTSTNATNDEEPPEDVDIPPGDADAAPGSVFGKSAEAKKPDPMPSKAAAKKATPVKRPAKKAAPAGPPAKKATPVKAPAKKAAPAAGSPPPTGQAVLKRWFRGIDDTAAQHPPKGNPTHNLRLTLGKPRQPINKYTWHRHEMFGNLAWTPEVRDGEQVEVAQGQFRVIEMGVDRGMHTLEISHAPHREEGQNNIPTVLHWKTVEPLLAATNYSGRNVIIERLADGTFRLEITDRQPTIGEHIN
jgi:hypothetical protein